MRRAVDVAVAAAVLALSSPVLALAMLAIRLESAGGAIYRQQRAGRDGREFEVLKLRTMISGAEHMGAGMAVDANDSRITRVGSVLRRTSLDELPNLVNVLRGDMSLIGPRPTLPSQVADYDERQRGRLAIRPGITGWAQVNGRASLPWSERIELDLYYIEHRSLRLDFEILRRTVGVLFAGEGVYRGETGVGPMSRAVMITSVGRRYDIVSSFAQHTTVVATEMSPLAPAQYAAQVREQAPPISDPGFVARLEELVACHDIGALIPLIDPEIEVLAAVQGRLPALVPSLEGAMATFDKWETHRWLERFGLPSPPTVLAGEEPDVYPVRIKPRRGSLGRDQHQAANAEQMRFFIEYVDEPVIVQRAMDGPEFSVDCLCDFDGRCLNAIPRTMIESRGGESVKGMIVADPELIELGRAVSEAFGARGPCMVQGFRDSELGLRVTDVNPRFGGGYPGHMFGALPGRTYPELIVAMANGERVEPHVGDMRAGVTFARFQWQIELDESLRPTGRDIVPGGPPPPR